MIGSFVLVGAVVLVGAGPARAGENTFVEVTPNSVQAGNRVSIRASCDNTNNRQAEAQSDAFSGRVTLRPDNGFLTGSTTIPGDKPAGDYQVELRCPNGDRAQTTLTVLNMTQPSKGPATGGGGTAGGRGTGSLLLVGGVAALAVVAGFGLFGRRRAGPGS
ncbi:hypothetical protein E1091_08305 [Micromonospora fluostatini]|uniref:Sortase n=1 Tax=Micromonospora fluostatini TaxID=1629071 RepID=A0ABY2DHU5_9ACTN|nr:hypothetical protein E1091_08305 [Micromonospora fluostatini]